MSFISLSLVYKTKSWHLPSWPTKAQILKYCQTLERQDGHLPIVGTVEMMVKYNHAALSMLSLLPHHLTPEGSVEGVRGSGYKWLSCIMLLTWTISSLQFTVFFWCFDKWVTARQNQQNDMCAKCRLRSAWASAQSDQSSQCTQWVAEDPMFLHAYSEEFDQTGQMPKLIWVFAGRKVILLVLSWGSSNNNAKMVLFNVSDIKCILWGWSEPLQSFKLWYYYPSQRENYRRDVQKHSIF